MNLSILDIDPDRGIVALPVRLTDITNLIAEGCDSRGKLSLGRLVSTGRGGLPSNPVEPLADEAVAANWVVVPESHQAETAERQPTVLQGNAAEIVSRVGFAEPDLGNSADASNSEDSPQPWQSISSPKPVSSLPQNRKPSFEIVEAQGWKLDSDGNVVLVAQAKTTEPQIPWLLPGTCPLP